MLNLTKLKALEAKATKGPWKNAMWGASVRTSEWERDICHVVKRGVDYPKNAELIAESRNQLPELIAWVEKAKDFIAGVEMCDEFGSSFAAQEEAAKLLGEVE